MLRCMTFMRRLAPLLILLSACDGAPSLGDLFEHLTPHERYARSLSQAGLDSTALGRDWLEAARRAVASPVRVTLPFREIGFFPADEAHAAGYRLTLRRGERLEISVQREGRPAAVFIDLFRASSDSLEPPDHLESADSLATSLAHDARRDADYIVRVQPELLRDLKYVVELRVAPSLAFPVAGRDDRAVRSFWGAERDGGRRVHQGIDIFAPRGTPVLAATDGFVRSASTSRLGGNVVWLWDAKGRQSLYYAHLDTQLVSGGERVRAGDTLGLVGNTGNARTTAPHLHFGIYVRGEGAVNPLPFVSLPRGELPRLVADTGALGDFVRSAAESLPVRPSLGGDTASARLARNTTMRVLGAAADAYRVRLPDGSVGYVAARGTAPGQRPGTR